MRYCQPAAYQLASAVPDRSTSTTDRDLAWFDFGVRPSVSGDGKLVAFTEAGEGAGGTYGVFVRPADGGAAVRLMDGGDGIISPDGTQVIANGIPDLHVGILAPMGAGVPKRISLAALDQIIGWVWFPDGRHVLIIGNAPGHPVRTWRLDTGTGKLDPVTAEGARARVISPSGRLLAVGAGTDRYLLDLQTGAKIVVKGVEPTDVPVGFTADSSAVYAFQPDAQGGRIFRIDIASGTRTARTLHPSDPAGLVGLGVPTVSLDGEHFASQRHLVQVAALPAEAAAIAVARGGGADCRSRKSLIPDRESLIHIAYRESLIHIPYRESLIRIRGIVS